MTKNTQTIQNSCKRLAGGGVYQELGKVTVHIRPLEDTFKMAHASQINRQYNN